MSPAETGMSSRIAVIALGLSSLLLAEDSARQKVQISKTEHFDFRPGGVLRLKNSIGELTVEGWDHNDVEITTVKSTKMEYTPQEREKAVQELDRVQVTAQRDGDELVITTGFPRSWCPLGAASFYLDYRIKVPASTRLIADHNAGEVHVDNLRGDIQVALRQGEITLHLPQDGKYTTDAKSNFGSVFSDFPGQEKRRFWLVGHRIEKDVSPGAHALNLRVGCGDIIILKTRIPKMPGPSSPAPKQDGA